jgi:ABC-type sugar transport system ATPase subunit
LSLGNKQRLGRAKALIHRPDLLILDEPANGLDPAGVVEIRGLLRELAHEHGVTIVLSSHVLAEVARLATRIGFIHAGRMVQEVDDADLAPCLRARLAVSAADPDAACAALRAAGMNPERDGNRSALIVPDDRAVHHPDEVATVLVSAGCPPTRLVVERDDLETYFLRLVQSKPVDGEDGVVSNGRTMTGIGMSRQMTLRELGVFVQEAFRAGASGDEAVTAKVFRGGRLTKVEVTIQINDQSSGEPR